MSDPTPTRYPVHVEIPVAWGEMDALGHVNNTVYFKYFESARIAYFRQVAMGFDPAGPILATASCTFVLPLAYPDTARVEIGVTRVGRASFTMAYRLFSVSRAALAATGETVCVWYDYASGKSTPLPDDARARIAAIEAAE